MIAMFHFAPTTQSRLNTLVGPTTDASSPMARRTEAMRRLKRRISDALYR
jgi:hypothetical protein